MILKSEGNLENEYDIDCLLWADKTKYYRQHLKFNDWEHFVVWLHECSQKTLKCKKDNFHMLSGTSPRTRRRKKGDIKETSLWIAMDFDNLKDVSFACFFKKLKSFGFEFVAYNSNGCREDDPRMRVVCPLSRKVKEEEYRHFWTNLNKMLGGRLDPQTKHIERTQACPASYNEAYNFFIRNRGKVIDVDEIKRKYPYFDRSVRLLSDSLINYKKRKMRGNNINWTSYQDCPFVSKKMVAEFYSIYNRDGSGRYHYIYKLMVSIACGAMKMNYPLQVNELVKLINEIDYNNLYKYRSLNVEAKRALDYAVSVT